MPKNPKQESYGNAYSNSASPANSVPGDRGNYDNLPGGQGRRRVFKQNAMSRGDPNGVEGGRGDGRISRAEYTGRFNRQTTDSNN